MTTSLVVTGTGTGIGKTVFAAALAGALRRPYWKPVQAGIEGETDSETVARLSGLGGDWIRPETYRLATPASPHLAARIDGIEIDVGRLLPPESAHIIEGAGGLMVPLTRDHLFVDLFQRWRLPVVLVAGTGLGTINHTLLSIEALRRRDIALLGIAFAGAAHDDNERIIAEISGVRRLGRLPTIEPLDAGRLAAAFRDSFRCEDFG